MDGPSDLVSDPVKVLYLIELTVICISLFSGVLKKKKIGVILEEVKHRSE